MVLDVDHILKKVLESACSASAGLYYLTFDVMGLFVPGNLNGSNGVSKFNHAPPGVPGVGP